MPADAPQRPEKAPQSAADGPAWATLPAGPRRPSERRLRALRGAPEGRGCGAAPETAPSDYATSVLRKSRNLVRELGHTFRNRD